MRRFYPWFGRYRRDFAEPFETINLRDAFVAGFISAGAYALRTSAQISEMVPALDVFADLLAADLDERKREAASVDQTDAAHSHRPGEDLTHPKSSAPKCERCAALRKPNLTVVQE